MTGAILTAIVLWLEPDGLAKQERVVTVFTSIAACQQAGIEFVKTQGARRPQAAIFANCVPVVRLVEA